MIELVACYRECKVHALMGGAASLPHVGPDLARGESCLPQRVHDIGNTIAHHYVSPHVRSGKCVRYGG
jgi:hypothetical protein